MTTNREADSGGAAAVRRERVMIACAWGVHFYTALGSVLGLLAIYYANLANFRASFIAMGAATVIDSSDGPLARALRVSERAPNFDGALLDNIVDYLTYVAAPVFVLIRARLLIPGWPGLTLGGFVMLASAYGFCHAQAKGEYFRGFPSYWNLVAFYLFCLSFSTDINMIIVGVLAVMVFMPIRFIYPNRTAPLRTLTLVLGIAWAFVTLAMLPMLPGYYPIMLYASLSYIAYYFIISFALHALTYYQNADSVNCR
ncbi:MAG: CDP-alcohol phosphatidyltransferase family protein [Candidatus Binataceae bacterium]